MDQKERKAQDDRGKEGKTERWEGRGKPGEIRGILQLYSIISHFRVLGPILTHSNCIFLLLRITSHSQHCPMNCISLQTLLRSKSKKGHDPARHNDNSGLVERFSICLLKLAHYQPMKWISPCIKGLQYSQSHSHSEPRRREGQARPSEADRKYPLICRWRYD